jgi:hypothetical protein
MERDKYYVYAWVNEENGDFFYIGKGKGKRYKQKSGRNDLFTKIINKYKCTSIILANNLTEEKALKLEKKLIKLYREKNMAKCNFLDGGDINPRLKGKNNPRSRKIVQLTLNGEFLKLFDCIRDGAKSVNGFDPPIIRALKKGFSAYGFRWVYLEEYNPTKEFEPINKYNEKIIRQYSLSGEFIKEWKSIREASKELNCCPVAIGYCLKKKTKTSKGFKWKYKDES